MSAGGQSRTRGRRRVLSVVGTRPNFMKVAPIVRALGADPTFEHVLVHTGQHYDDAMSRVFFTELQLPAPDVYLGIGSGSHTAQTARVLAGLAPVLAELTPDVVLVPGDVNSTLAAALAAEQAGLSVGHIEAGLRSFDRTMPEELNRVLIDQISDLLFIHSPEAREHLLAEGRPAEAIHEVGNTMIDTLVHLRGVIAGRNAAATFELEPRGYVLVTLHRPALVDGPQLARALAALARTRRFVRSALPGPSSHASTDCPICGTTPSAPALDRTTRLPGLPRVDENRCRRCSPTRAGYRRRRPTSECHASRCETTQSGRLRSNSAPTGCSDSHPNGSPRFRS